MALWTAQKNVFCVLGPAETKSKRVQGNFHPEFNHGRHDDVPSYVSIMKRDRQLRDTGSLLSNRGEHSRSEMSDENVERIRTSFVRSPKKSTRKIYQDIDDVTPQMLLNALMEVKYGIV
ncbi:hypothetical protein C0J52_28138 [Blattella germanica]|nr:hypothetical protein C0J52_28138 [Blattella germanica]